MIYGLILALIVALLALMAFVRLAPSDPTRWNVPVADSTILTAGPCADKVRVVSKGARATCQLSGTPAQTLARLDAIAGGMPRTKILAGSVADGRITWVSRSLIMGYPDYITAEATAASQGTRLDIFSRQRFGAADFGVNAARLMLWLAALDQTD